MHARTCALAGTIVAVSCAILFLLFCGQRYGTSRVGFTFAPIIIIWYASNVMINLYNIITYYPGAPLPAPALHLTCHQLRLHGMQTVIHASPSSC